MKLLFASALGLTLFGAASAHADDAEINAKIAQLEQEIQLLKRQQEVKEEVAKTNAEKTANVEFNKKGLTVSSNDKNFVATLGGYAQIDTRSFVDDKDRGGKNDILLRALRPQLNVTLYKDFSFFFAPDFSSSGYKLFDAYAQYHYSDPLQLRVGKMKPPLSLERLQAPTATFFTERGPTSNLVTSRDVGVELFGDLVPGALEYQVGLFDGGPDLGNNDSDDDDSKDIEARIYTQPFANAGPSLLQGLGFGIGGSNGNRSGTVSNPILPAYKTPGQATFFSYRAGAFAKGDNWRLVPQSYYSYNNFSMLGEYAISSQDVKLGANEASLKNTAWEIEAGLILTGEDANFRGDVHPENSFDPKSGGWGAFELVGRVGQTNVDKDAYPIFASPTAAASQATDLGVGVNWYLNDSIKLMADYENTSFDGGKTTGDRRDENVILTRCNINSNNHFLRRIK